MPPNPLLVMVSVDCDVYAKMLVAREWEGVSQHLLKGIDRLVLAGCNMICKYHTKDTQGMLRYTVEFSMSVLWNGVGGAFPSA